MLCVGKNLKKFELIICNDSECTQLENILKRKCWMIREGNDGSSKLDLANNYFIYTQRTKYDTHTIFAEKKVK